MKKKKTQKKKTETKTLSVETTAVETQTLISKMWNVLYIIFIWHISRCCGVPGFSTCIQQVA